MSDAKGSKESKFKRALIDCRDAEENSEPKSERCKNLEAKKAGRAKGGGDQAASAKMHAKRAEAKSKAQAQQSKP